MTGMPDPLVPRDNERRRKSAGYFVGIGAIAGAVVGTVVYGLLSFVTAAEGWEDVSAIAGAMFGFVGGAIVGAAAGWAYWRVFAPRRGKGG